MSWFKGTNCQRPKFMTLTSTVIAEEDGGGCCGSKPNSTLGKLLAAICPARLARDKVCCHNQ
jgi:hypothetical protein